MAYVYAIIAGSSDLLSGWFAIRVPTDKIQRRYVIAFTAGVLVALTFFDILPAGALKGQASANSSGSGRIAGRVRVEGHIKKPPPLKVYKNRDFCGAEVSNEILLFGAEGVLRNAVIIIHGTQNKNTARPLKTLVLDNKNCAFVPHVQVASVGSEILLLNSDPILHDVHARIGSETLFNVGLPSWRQVKKRLTRLGIITVECNVLHTWMSAYIVVTPSPSFAVTNEKGEFLIEGIPPGAREIEVWHEKLGRLSRKIEVMENQTSRVDLAFPCAGC